MSLRFILFLLILGTSTASAQILDVVVVNTSPEAGRKAPTPDALKMLRAKVEADPGNRTHRFALITALRAASDLPAALQAAKAWRKKDAYNLVVVRLIGDLLVDMGKLDAAQRAYSAVVELLPDDASAHRALGTVLKQAGDLTGAYARLSVAATLKPDDVRISFELADLAHRLERNDEAITRFRAIADSTKASEGIRYPARQRLAQLYSSQRRDRLTENNTEAAKALAADIKALKVKGGAVNDIKIYLSWDTDRTDVDLWVINPKGEKVFYGNKADSLGGRLFHDVILGYGPESYTAHKAIEGTYTIVVHYFSTDRRRFSEARGEVVIVLNEGTAFERRHTLPYRIFHPNQKVTVARIIPAEEGC